VSLKSVVLSNCVSALASEQESLRDHAFITSTRKSGVWPLPLSTWDWLPLWTSTCRQHV